MNNRLSVSDTVPANVGSGSHTQWHNGWTVGAGWEYGITANWIVGVEYDYSAFETKRYQLAGAAVGNLHLRYQAPRHSVGRGPSELQVRRPGRREVLINDRYPGEKAPAQAGAFSFV